MLLLRTLIFVSFAGLCPMAAWAQDAAHTDPDKYRVILENDCVRVLDYQDRPGERTLPHRHPDFVLYALGPFKRKLTLPDGKVLLREFKRGDVMWSDAQTHTGENVGDAPTHVLMVELKKPSPGTGACAKG